MSDTPAGFGDIFALLGAPNPFTTATKTFDQFRRAIDEFLNSVQTFNRTMDSLNDTAERVNRLLDDIEEPVRAFLPQVTRSIKAADAMVSQLSGPIEKVAPGLSRLADTLNSPIVTGLPSDLTEVVASLRDLARHMQPLSQLADSAAAMFGIRSFLPGGSRPTPSTAPRPATSFTHARLAPVVAAPAPESPPAKKAPARKKAATKKAAAKKAAVTRSPAKKSSAKGSPAKRSGAAATRTTRSAPKKSPAKKAAAKRAPGPGRSAAKPRR